MDEGLTMREALELMERRAKDVSDAEAAKLTSDEVRAMAGAEREQMFAV